MAVTEAEVKRLLADIVGKKLVAGRLGSLERLRGFLAVEEKTSSAMRLAADGLLAIVADPAHPAEVRARCVEVLDGEIGREVFREWASEWPRTWTERFVAILSDREQPQAARILALRALEARVLEEPAFEPELVAIVASELSFDGNSVPLRLACLDALVETRRSDPDWLALLRAEGRIELVELPSWEDWEAFSPDERRLAAVLVDPSALARAAASPEDGAELALLEAVELHTRHDATNARRLASHVRALMSVARAAARETAVEVVGHAAERTHIEVLCAAVAYERAKGTLHLSWVEAAIVEAVERAAALAFELGAEPRFDDHLRLWLSLFRDGGRGLADRFLAVVRSCKTIDARLPPAWVALHALREVAPAHVAEATRRLLDLVASVDEATARSVRLDVLLAMVAPEHILELQERGALPTVDVPTEEELRRLYRDEMSTLPRRVRLARLVQVLEEGRDHDRIVPALVLLPRVVRWLPSELVRFEPLVRKYFGDGRSVQQRRRVLAPSDPTALGSRAFDAYVACVDEIRLLHSERRPETVVAWLADHVAEIARAAFAHGHGARAIAGVLGEIVPAARMADARAFWMQGVRDSTVPAARRIDAYAALEMLEWPTKEEELGGLLEEVLGRSDDPELGAFLVEPFLRDHPARFEAARAAGRLRIEIPPVEHLFAYRDGERPRRHGLHLVRERRDAVAAAIRPELVLDVIEAGEPLPILLGAVHLAPEAVRGREDLVPRARAALAARMADARVYEASIEGQPEAFSLAAASFEAYLATLDTAPVAPPDAAVDALMGVLDRLLRSLDDASLPDLDSARAIVTRFAADAGDVVRRAAVAAIERRMEDLFASRTRTVEALEGIIALHRDALALLGGQEAAERASARLREVFADRGACAGARWSAFRILHALSESKGAGTSESAAAVGSGTGGDRAEADALLDQALAIFMDAAEDGALRALVGGVITILRPEAFADIVDMNTQPWTVRRPEHAWLPANSLPVNMPLSWLVASLCMAEHDEPHHRAVTELVTRLQPARPWEWPRTRARWLDVVGARAAEVRRGLRGALERPEPKHVTGRHAHAARLLALFGEEEDAPVLADVAGRWWTETTPPLDVFWRPAGKAPALGRYSFLELYLEVGFGTEGRYRILSEAYALAAERAEAAGEGGTASRYAYEAFLLAPDSDRAKALLDRLNRF